VARDALPEALREQGLEVDVLDLYETVAEPLSEVVLRAATEADYITFTSSSTVRFFFGARNQDAALSPATRVVSIGPLTSMALREHGVEPHLEAPRHDTEGLLAALLSDAAGDTSPPVERSANDSSEKASAAG
jgi:uroporphyrinogen-III synthase